MDEAQGCSGWIVWQILGRFDLILTAWNLDRGKQLIWGCFSSFWGFDGGPLHGILRLDQLGTFLFCIVAPSVLNH